MTTTQSPEAVDVTLTQPLSPTSALQAALLSYALKKLKPINAFIFWEDNNAPTSLLARVA